MIHKWSRHLINFGNFLEKAIPVLIGVRAPAARFFACSIAITVLDKIDVYLAYAAAYKYSKTVYMTDTER